MRINSEILLGKLFKFNILWAGFGSIVLAFILNFVETSLLFALKDVIFYLSIPIILVFVRTSLPLNLILILVFCLYVLLITTVLYDLERWQIYNMRQLIAPLVILSISNSMKFNEENSEKIIRFCYRFITLIVFVGIAFLIFDLWSYLSLRNYFTLKGIPVNAEGVSYMFYEPAVGYAQRMVSTFLDPINLGHTIAAFLIMAYYKIGVSGRKRKWYLFIFFTGLLLTFSKGAILQVVLAIYFFNKEFNTLKRFLIPILFITLVLLLVDLKGILIHLKGLSNALENINLFGHGLGMVGNYAKMFAEDLTTYHRIGISDTFIGSILGQIGIIGLLFWLLFFKKHIKNIVLHRKNNVGSIIIVSQLVLSVLSENTLNFTSFIIPGTIAGVVFYYQKCIWDTAYNPKLID